MLSLSSLEPSHSGLVRALGKRVGRKVSRVRISPPPPEIGIQISAKNMVGAKRRLFCIPPTKSGFGKNPPGPGGLKKYGSILNLKVRTDFFEFPKKFFGNSLVCQFYIVFQKLCGKFEPIIRFF